MSSAGLLTVLVGKSGGVGFDYFSLLLHTLFFMAWVGVGGVVLFAVLTVMGEFRTAEYDEQNKVQDDPAKLLFLTAIGTVAARGVTLRLCKGPFLRGGQAGVEEAIKFVLAAAATGEAVMWLGWQLQGEMPRTERERLSWNAAVGWVFLPSVIILARARLWMSLVAVMVVVAVVMLSLRREIPAWEEEEESDERTLRYLYGTPALRGWRGVIPAAVLAQVALALAVGRWMVTACVLLGVAAAMTAWRWSAAAKEKKKPSKRRLWARLVAAMLVAFVTTVMTQVALPKLGVYEEMAPKIAKADTKTSTYFSVVLLAPVDKKVVAPKLVPTAQNAMRGRLAKPMIIPFNGPYWYFEPPLVRPGSEAQVMHGRSTEQNPHTLDGSMLLMEAHQALKQPVDVSSCREIDVALTNAETRLGKIMVGVMLRDSLGDKRQILMLRDQPLVSSEETEIDPHRVPVDETLRFPVEQRGVGTMGKRLTRFDDITVLFVREGRLTTGSKVAVRAFTLEP